MKFHYAYHDRENRRQDGFIKAASRDEAYALLRKQGIKPTHVDLASGFFNRLASIGKRGLAIIVLAVIACAAVSVAIGTRRAAIDAALFEPRQQIYGDPGVMAEIREGGWASVFPDIGDQWLAQHAIPATKCLCADDPVKKPVAEALMSGRKRFAEIAPDDLAEVAKIKRIVNWMKAELCEYVDDGGTVAKYMRRVEIRQKAEIGIYDRMRGELLKERDQAVYREKNAKLRLMGLPMVERPFFD